MQPTPTISVVIPTRDRPEMLAAAVRSALAQTLPPLEVIVVLDGSETSREASRKTLAGIEDNRVRVLQLGNSHGGGAARNFGVSAALGKWIAFLDDDDLWLPQKLEVQMGFARTLPANTEVVLSCAMVARSPQSEEVWPRRPYRSGQPMAEYLFCRAGWRYGEALLQTSTLVTTRSLLQRVPFADGLARHQDWDWLLRVAAEPGVAVHAVSGEPLAIFHIGGSRSSVSRSADWRFSLRWATERRSLFLKRAFAGFVATECAAQASRQGGWERLAFLRAALPFVVCSPRALVQLFGFLFTSQAFRRRLRVCIRESLTAAVLS